MFFASNPSLVRDSVNLRLIPGIMALELATLAGLFRGKLLK